MDVLLSLLILLVGARLSGELAARMKAPALVGEILAGIVLGPSVFGFVRPDAAIQELANLGIFFIVYLAALELTLADVRRSIRDSGIVIAIGAFTIPALAGTALGGAIGLAPSSAMFLGIALAFTALPVMARILSDLDLLHTPLGRSLLSAGLLCDVAGLLGLHFVVGAFFGTLLVSEHVIADRDVKAVRSATSAITLGVFGPVFFAFIGLTFEVGSLGNVVLVGAVLGVAAASKFVGGYVGAAWSHMPRRDCMAVGIGMNGRGAMELVVATLGLELGLIDGTLFSILVLTGVVTTLMTPFGLRFIFRRTKAEDASPPHVRAPGDAGGLNGGT